MCVYDALACKHDGSNITSWLKLILSMWDPLCEYKKPIAIGVGQRSLRSKSENIMDMITHKMKAG